MGGSKPSTQIVQAPPQPPAPSAGQTAEDIYRARLQYDPQIAALEYAMAQQYAPQYGQLFAQTAEQQFPGIGALTGTGMQQAQQRLESPFGYTPEEQAYIDAIRQRQRGQLTQSIRERANLGGGLYSGRAETQEGRMLSELEQAFGQEDIGRRLQGGLYAQQQAIPYLQMLYPQIQQTPAVSQSAVPQASQIYQAMFEASRRPSQAFYSPGQPNPIWGMLGAGAGAAGGALAGGFATPGGLFGTGGSLLSSIRYKKNIKLWAKH